MSAVGATARPPPEDGAAGRHTGRDVHTHGDGGRVAGQDGVLALQTVVEERAARGAGFVISAGGFRESYTHVSSLAWIRMRKDVSSRPERLKK